MVAVREESVGPRLGPPSLSLVGKGLSHLDTWRRPPHPVAVPAQAGLTRMSDIISAWRAAERALGEHRGSSREVAVLEAEIGVWRAAYQRIFAELRARHDALRADDPWRGLI